MSYNIENLRDVNSLEDMDNYVEKLRVLASNNRDNEEILSLVTIAIQKCELIKDQKSLVKLYEIMISQIQHSKENFPTIENLVLKMKEISEKIEYYNGLALAYNVEWYIEKYKGNKQRSREALDKSMRFIALSDTKEYEYYACNYSFAFEKWLHNHDDSVENILEECFNYFLTAGYYRSSTFTLGILILIYQKNQKKNKIMDIIRKILSNREMYKNLPNEIKSIICYFIGVGSKMSFDLRNSETYLHETQSILKHTYRNSTYTGYYVRGLAHLTACYALQGKLRLANNQMVKVEKLIEEGIATRNLDTFGKKQIEHDFNLTKFYIHSRLQPFQIDQLQDLIQNILNNLDKQHSDAIFFSEFLLNGNLSREQLLKIKNLQNPSTRRVEHIINFLIEKTNNTKEKQIINLISVLKRRPVEERMTLVERAFADLLAAQEYFKIERYAEIYPLLRKYENQLNRIQVLELRIFMEAFIQIGAFKNGDPMGPALQYVAIRKCQQYGFSRLENKLLNYLDLQAKDVLKTLKRIN